MAIEKDLLDQLLAGRDPKDVFNKDGPVDELKKALSERILNAEIDEHLRSGVGVPSLTEPGSRASPAARLMKTCPCASRADGEHRLPITQR